MSKRFGRNQKRRARAVVKQALETAEVSLKVAANARRGEHLAREQAHKAKQVLREFIEALPDHSIHAPATLAEHLGRFEPRTRQFQVYPPLEFAFEDMDSQTAAVITTQTMHRLHTLVERSDFKEQMHLEVRLTDGSVGYAVSEAALRAMRPEDFERVIARRLAHEFIPALTKQGFLKGR